MRIVHFGWSLLPPRTPLLTDRVHDNAIWRLGEVCEINLFRDDQPSEPAPYTVLEKLRTAIRR